MQATGEGVHHAFACKSQAHTALPESSVTARATSAWMTTSRLDTRLNYIHVIILGHASIIHPMMDALDVG